MSSKHAAKLQNFVHEELVWDLEKDVEFLKCLFKILLLYGKISLLKLVTIQLIQLMLYSSPISDDTLTHTRNTRNWRENCSKRRWNTQKLTHKISLGQKNSFYFNDNKFSYRSIISVLCFNWSILFKMPTIPLTPTTIQFNEHFFLDLILFSFDHSNQNTRG